MPVPAATLTVLYEDSELLAVNKPAGLVCHPTKGDAFSSLISRLRLHCGAETVHLINRLDRETSGVSLAAKSREAAAALGRLFETRAVRKEYRAMVHGFLENDEYLVEAPLGRDDGSPVAIQDCVRPDGAPATTRVEVLQRFRRQGRPFSLVRAEPLTGRKHQIRIHLAHLGHPIVGDKIYGGDPTRYLRFVADQLTDGDRAALGLANQALHAARLVLPWREKEWTFETEPEAAFREFLAGAVAEGPRFSAASG